MNMKPVTRKRIAQLTGHAVVIAITLATGINPLLVIAVGAAGGLVSGASRAYFEERSRRMVGELLESLDTTSKQSARLPSGTDTISRIDYPCYG